MIRKIAGCLILILVLSCCSSYLPYKEQMCITNEAVALAESPPSLTLDLTPVASGTKTKLSNNVNIDYSNTQDGYVMVSAYSTKRMKCQVVNTTTYTYDLPSGQWSVFPLSDGNGRYKVTVFENISGTKYSTLNSVSFDVTLNDEFAPFLRSNQYVNFQDATQTKAKASELCGNCASELDKVKAIYDYVVQNLKYDKELARTVKSGYLPNLDSVLEKKSGICFDYAALMAGMLRSQMVPTKLVVGYTGSAYHAWINVYSPENGWINAAIYFDGESWKLMDPAFASSGKESDSIMKYIGDGRNYTAKYFY